MSTLASLIFLSAIGIGSLLTVAIANWRQEKAKRVSHRVNFLKRQADEIEEIALFLDHIVETPQIVQHLYDEALRLIDTMHKLQPKSPVHLSSMTQAQQLAADLSNLHRPRNLNRVMASDARIAQAKKQLTEAAQFLHQRFSRGNINAVDLKSFIEEIESSANKIEIFSYVGQGLLLKKKNDNSGANAFFQRAQQVISEKKGNSKMWDQLDTELKDLINNKRLLPSPVLMPEAQAVYDSAQ